MKVGDWRGEITAALNRAKDQLGKGVSADELFDLFEVSDSGSTLQPACNDMLGWPSYNAKPMLIRGKSVSGSRLNRDWWAALLGAEARHALGLRRPDAALRRKWLERVRRKLRDLDGADPIDCARAARVGSSEKSKPGILEATRQLHQQHPKDTARDLWNRFPSSAVPQDVLVVAGFELYRTEIKNRKGQLEEMLAQENGLKRETAITFAAFRKYVTRAKKTLRSY